MFQKHQTPAVEVPRGSQWDGFVRDSRACLGYLSQANTHTLPEQKEQADIFRDNFSRMTS